MHGPHNKGPLHAHENFGTYNIFNKFGGRKWKLKQSHANEDYQRLSLVGSQSFHWLGSRMIIADIRI